MNGYDDYQPRPRRHWFAIFFLVLGSFALGALLDRVGLLPGSGGKAPSGLGRTFGEAWDLVETHYVDQGKVNHKNMTDGAIEGMLTSLGDVGHTTYLTADELERLQSSLKGEMEGIGAHVSMRKDRPTIMQVLPNSPAQRAHLLANDVIQEVDGKAVAGMSLQQVVALVRGPKDTQVHLTIVREGESQPIQVAVTRERIPIPLVSWHALPGTELAHVAIHEFGADTDNQLRKALKEIRDQHLKGLIVDLRGNPGGLKDQAIAVTSEFLADGNVFLEQDAHGNRQPVPVTKGGQATDIPICVLIDQGTASSAEIFAGAIQDHKRGTLVGTRTFGTGTVLQPFPLSDGSAVLLAVSEWLTPDGREIWHHGIEPTYEVPLPRDAAVLFPEIEDKLTAEGLNKSTDAQVLKAIAVLQGK